MRMTRFWRTLEELNGGATSQYEWVRFLGDEFASAAVHFRKSGQLAEALVCPRAGENGCMREVVTLVDGRLRAECGDTPSRCNHVDLDKTELMILEIDRGKLTKAIGRALKLSDMPTAVPRKGAYLIGRHEISAGRGFPVFLYMPQPALGLDPADLDPVLAPPPGPRLLLLPTRRAAALRVSGGLDRYQTTTMALEDVLLWDEKRGLVAVEEPTLLFADLLSGIASGAATQGPAVALRPGTQWSSISIDFQESELAMLRGPEMQRAISPADLNLADRRNGRARHPWLWLRTFALHDGRMPTGKASAQKHKQAVTEALEDFTGIRGPAIDDEQGHYIARFALTASGLR